MQPSREKLFDLASAILIGGKRRVGLGIEANLSGTIGPFPATPDVPTIDSSAEDIGGQRSQAISIKAFFVGTVCLQDDVMGRARAVGDALENPVIVAEDEVHDIEAGLWQGRFHEHVSAPGPLGAIAHLDSPNGRRLIGYS
jgi:hypothetical protein